ncbi:MAG: DUF59 domain-containing protein [Geminicoccaceae bacterium]
MSDTSTDQAAIDSANAFLEADDGEAEVSKERMAEVQAMGDKVIDVLRDVFDPEIPVNIYDMGLIYKIDIDDDNVVHIDMTLTSPACPVAETLPPEVEYRVKMVEEVGDAKVSVVWEPPWHPSMMSEEAQLELGMIY